MHGGQLQVCIEVLAAPQLAKEEDSVARVADGRGKVRYDRLVGFGRGNSCLDFFHGWANLWGAVVVEAGCFGVDVGVDSHD